MILIPQGDDKEGKEEKGTEQQEEEVEEEEREEVMVTQNDQRNKIRSGTKVIAKDC